MLVQRPNAPIAASDQVLWNRENPKLCAQPRLYMPR
jgi:hypothetical protein